MNLYLALSLGIAVCAVGPPHKMGNEPIAPLARSYESAVTLVGADKPGGREQSGVQAIHDIGRVIVVATTNSRDAAKRMNIISPAAEQAFLKATGLKNSKFLEAMIFNEFMYFYIFMTTREARIQKMSQSQVEDVRDLLVTSLSKVAIAAYFDDWSPERKEKMLAEFYSKLHDADREYDQGAMRGSTEQEQLTALFSKIGSNVSQLCNSEGVTTVARPVSEIAKHEWMGMEMQRRMAEARHAYREHSPK